MRRGLQVGAIVSLVAGIALVATLERPIRAADTVDLQVRSLAKDKSVFVSFTLTNGFTEELRAAIRAGLPATITYEVELRRGGLLWFDRTLATTTVRATARYDNLTRQHHLSRTIDGRGEEPRLTEDEALVRDWMTEFRQLPLFSTAQLEANTEYYVRVRARTRPRVNWYLFWPWEHGAPTGEARFTFIP
jgi:hypothetical protein